VSGLLQRIGHDGFLRALIGAVLDIRSPSVLLQQRLDATGLNR